jgi:hypothetical protein
MEHELITRLAALDVDALSPRDAQQLLYELRKSARDARED